MLTLIAGRLVWLQGFQASAYAAQAVEQRTSTITLTAPRGQILDRDGETLALSVDARAVYGEPRTISRAVCTPTEERPCDPAGIAGKLAPLLDLPAEEIESKLVLAPKATGAVCNEDELIGCKGFAYLARGLEADEANEIRDLGLVGIGIVAEPRRVHPGKDLAANIVGFTTVEGSGAAGIEERFDDVLAGTDGRTVAEVDGGGRIIPNGRSTTVEPRAGGDVQLTIDRDLQWNAQKVLTEKLAEAKAESGSATIIDVQTGEVLALASVPTFDAEDPGAADAAVRGNRAVTDVFEPGSIGKVITAAAALEEGVLTPDSVLSVPDSIQVSNKRFSDSHSHPTEQMTFTGVLVESSNVGTIMAAQKVGGPKLHAMLERFGIGARTGIELPAESPGILRDEKDEWSKTDYGTHPIGHGYSVNGVQMASVYATVANGGVRVQPTVIKATTGPDGEGRRAARARAHAGPEPGGRRPAARDARGRHERGRDGRHRGHPRLPRGRQDRHRAPRRRRPLRRQLHRQLRGLRAGRRAAPGHRGVGAGAEERLLRRRRRGPGVPRHHELLAAEPGDPAHRRAEPRPEAPCRVAAGSLCLVPANPQGAGSSAAAGLPSPLPLRPSEPVPRPLTDLLAEVPALRAQSELGGTVVTGCTLDSRAVQPGDLYAALPGARAHGADFAVSAVHAGAAAVLTDGPGAARLGGCGVPVLVADDPRAVLGAVSRWVHGDPGAGMTLVGLTGTNGKTTTAFLVEAGLQAAGHRTGLLGTVLTRIGDDVVPSVRTTPEAPDLQALLAVMRERGTTAVAMEVSSHALALGRVDGVRYDVAGFTNLSQDHLDFHASMQEYEAAKASLFTPSAPAPAWSTSTTPPAAASCAARRSRSSPSARTPTGRWARSTCAPTAAASGCAARVSTSARRCACRASSTPPTPSPRSPAS